MRYFRDSGVSAVLESSFTSCKLRFCARSFLALTKISLFLEAPRYSERGACIDRGDERYQSPDWHCSFPEIPLWCAAFFANKGVSVLTEHLKLDCPIHPLPGSLPAGPACTNLPPTRCRIRSRLVAGLLFVFAGFVFAGLVFAGFLRRAFCPVIPA
jgi:hypothetical protein